jgi:hypothetical protein
MPTLTETPAIEPLLTNEETAAIFGYKLPDQRSSWSQFAAAAGVPLIRLTAGKIMADRQQIRDFIASRSTRPSAS